MSAFKLSNTLQISKEEADKLIKKYFQATSKLKSYLRACADYGLKHGYIRTYYPFRGIRWFPQWREDLNRESDFKIIGEIERACFNTPVQGSAAEITKLALCKVRDYILSNSLKDKVKLIHVVHDAIYCEVVEDYAEDWSLIQDKLMKDAWNEVIKDLPIETDITISDHWQK